MSCQNCGDSFIAGVFIGGVLTLFILWAFVFKDTYTVYDSTGEIVIKANKEYYKLTKATDEQILNYIKENK